MTDQPHIESSDDGVVIDVKVVPGGSREQIAGVLGGALKLKVTAPPEGGKANKAVCALLARSLGVAKRDVSVDSGHSQPHKRIAIRGVTIDNVRAAMQTLGK